jgi:hypothetical protein
MNGTPVTSEIHESTAVHGRPHGTGIPSVHVHTPYGGGRVDDTHENDRGQHHMPVTQATVQAVIAELEKAGIRPSTNHLTAQRTLRKRGHFFSTAAVFEAQQARSNQ